MLGHFARIICSKLVLQVRIDSPKEVGNLLTITDMANSIICYTIYNYQKNTQERVYDYKVNKLK